MKQPQYKIIYSNFINPLSDIRADFICGALVLKLTANNSYKIVGLYSKLPAKFLKLTNVRFYHFQDRVALPAFFDMHFHWVQDDVRYAPKKHLLTWLEKYVFPHEAKFKNREFSQKKAKQFFEKLYATGTIGGAIYGSIHANSVTDALKYAKGEFIAGNVVMTMHSPQPLLQSPKAALKLIQKLAVKFKKKYAFTPRFALTCDPETMNKGGTIAKNNGSFTQTHLSENPFEIETILKIFRALPAFKKVKSYTEIYDQCKLLTKNSFYAHAIHLDKSEWKLLAKRGAKIIHCPTSNAPLKEFGLGSGLFDFRQADHFKVDWALGSDIGGGMELSMLTVIDSFVKQNKRAKRYEATYVKALYRATLKGAEFLKVDKRYGNFAKNKMGNFVIVPLPKKGIQANAEKMLVELFKDKNLFSKAKMF